MFKILKKTSFIASLFLLLLFLNGCDSQPKNNASIPTEAFLTHTENPNKNLLTGLAKNLNWNLHLFQGEFDDQPNFEAYYRLDRSSVFNSIFSPFSGGLFETCTETPYFYALDGQNGFHEFGCEGKKIIVKLALLFTKPNIDENDTYVKLEETLGKIETKQYGSNNDISFHSTIFIEKNSYWIKIYESSTQEERLFTPKALDLIDAEIEKIITLGQKELNLEGQEPYLMVLDGYGNGYIVDATVTPPEEWGYFFVKMFNTENGAEIPLDRTFGNTKVGNEFTTDWFHQYILPKSTDETGETYDLYFNPPRVELWFHAMDSGLEEKIKEVTLQKNGSSSTDMLARLRDNHCDEAAREKTLIYDEANYYMKTGNDLNNGGSFPSWDYCEFTIFTNADNYFSESDTLYAVMEVTETPMLSFTKLSFYRFEQVGQQFVDITDDIDIVSKVDMDTIITQGEDSIARLSPELVGEDLGGNFYIKLPREGTTIEFIQYNTDEVIYELHWNGTEFEAVKN